MNMSDRQQARLDAYITGQRDREQGWPATMVRLWDYTGDEAIAYRHGWDTPRAAMILPTRIVPWQIQDND